MSTHPRLKQVITEVHSSDTQNIFKTYNPDFMQNVQLGYIRDTYTVTMGGAISPIDEADGEVIPISGYAEAIPTAGVTVDTVEVVSTDAADTGVLAVVGTDLFGDEYAEVIALTGTTPVTLEELFLSVHYMLYLPIPGFSTQSENAGTITCTSQLNPLHDTTPASAAYRHVIMPPGACKGTNAIYRVPKYQSAIIPSYNVSAQGSCGGVLAMIKERFGIDAATYNWTSNGVAALRDGLTTVELPGKRALLEGDVLMLTAKNTVPGTFANIYWGFRLVHSILDHAPADYERPWRSIFGTSPWSDIPPG